MMMAKVNRTLSFVALLSSATSVVVTGAVLCAGSLVPAHALAAVEKAACKVHAVHGVREGDGSIPAELAFLEDQLRDDQFAAFKSFKLLEAKTLKLELKKPASAALKSGHEIRLELLGSADKRLKLHAMLSDRRGSKPLVSTDYVIESNGVLIVGGPAYQNGKLFFAIQCAARQ